MFYFTLMLFYKIPEIIGILWSSYPEQNIKFSTEEFFRIAILRSSQQRCPTKKAVLKNFAIFT